MTEPGILNLVDTLNIGGTERVAVNIVNRLSQVSRRSYLCTTRKEGPLADLVLPEVGRLSLNRSRTVQWSAIRRLVDYIRQHEIGVLHAHGSSIVTANLASRFAPYPKIVWHDHFGTNERKERPVWLYRTLMRRVGGIVAVSQPLADWSRERLGFRQDRIWWLPNFVDTPDSVSMLEDLPGQKGRRIVCVANVRPVKDHMTLIRAMEIVVKQNPDAHLLLVGSHPDPDYLLLIEREIQRLGLPQSVTLLGTRQDVPDLLLACDIGVLSSINEGLPVSLLEYGAASLPVVATRVGQCGAVLDDGRAGVLVPASDSDQLGAAINSLLGDDMKRESLGRAFASRVREHYSAESVMKQLLEIYDMVLAG